RHGLVAGATGTGKTVTLQILAEGFSNEGVPVFAADVKGDLSGIAMKGLPQDFLDARAKEIGFETYAYEASPAVFWDLYGQNGHPIRTTITDLGPVLLSRILSLNDVQEGVLNIVFKYADDNKLLLLDLKDLRKVLELLGSDKDLQTQLKASYGNISSATIGTIQRQLLVLEQQG
ncbi:MAG: helicase HerA-like domain-containing protein, partial [Pseudomonadota bacterium]